jgi:hypothetical protein
MRCLSAKDAKIVVAYDISMQKNYLALIYKLFYLLII